MHITALSAVLAALVISGTAGAQTAPVPPKAFASCSVCHKVTPDGRNGIGPNLRGIAGRTSGALAGYAYSPAMKAAKIKWNRARLMEFMSNPAKRIPGTKMAYPGQSDPAAAAAVADYLMALR